MPVLDELLLKKQTLLTSDKKIRARNAAEDMGISEAQFVALSLGKNVQEIDMINLKSLFNKLASLGELMALTRNAEVVMERRGLYQNPQFDSGNILLVNSNINLRLRTRLWTSGFAVEENGRHSLQFFDATGTAAHKIYATDLTLMKPFHDLVAEFCLADSTPKILNRLAPQSEPPKNKTDIDAKSLQQAWRNLNDAHQINPLLTHFGLSRLQAYQLLSEQDAQPLKNTALKSLFTQAAEQQIPLMIFVANGCATQIFTGTVHKLLETSPWFNVLDPGFDLHINLTGIHQAWLVKKYLKSNDSREQAKPTYSLEFFNPQGEVVMFIYLEPQANQSPKQQSQWHDLTQSLSA